ncbi:MAG: diaminopimelate epimerase [Bacteroidetes bacterium]|nr:diaminopimelate epimerase [Bacteroidota bacterium]
MKPELILEFTKMNGAGNDFVVIDNRFFNFTPDELSALASSLCRRRTSVGADGLLGLETRNIPESVDFRMRYYNADGSPGSMCGNGARCLVQFASDGGVFRGSECTFVTDAGDYSASITEAGVRLYVPDVSSPAITGVSVPGSPERARSVWTGTEHAVCFVDNVDQYPVATHGPALRQKRDFGPNGANVNFVGARKDGSSLSVRTWEKGVEAETLACGTGAIASAITAFESGLIDASPAAVQMKGGTLVVGFRKSGDQYRDVFLEGPTATVFRGSLPLSL